MVDAFLTVLAEDVAVPQSARGGDDRGRRCRSTICRTSNSISRRSRPRCVKRLAADPPACVREPFEPRAEVDRRRRPARSPNRSADARRPSTATSQRRSIRPSRAAAGCRWRDFRFDRSHERAQLDGARIISRLMRQMDFGAVQDDGSIVVVFAETDLRNAHMIARRLSSVMKHTIHAKREVAHRARRDGRDAAADPIRRSRLLARLDRGSAPRCVVNVHVRTLAALRAGARSAQRCRIEGVSHGPGSASSCKQRRTASGTRALYAALRSSARLASCRRISVVPISRSSGVSHSWKNTTFMSGRTLAAWPCWRMK